MRIIKIYLVLILLIIVFTGCNNDRFKNYVVKHRKDIYQTGENYFRIDNCELRYYEYVTIGTYNDSAYYMVFWGDRDSWKWRFKKDKNFEVDVRYERSKGNHVYNDIAVLYSLELAELKN